MAVQNNSLKSKSLLVLSNPLSSQFLLFKITFLFMTFFLLSLNVMHASNLKDIDKNDIIENDNAKEDPKCDGSVSIDWNIPVNQNHFGYEIFSKWNDAKICKLYQENIRMNKIMRTKNSDSPTEIVRYKDEFNSLIFTIKKGDRLYFDTLQNFVNPQKKFPKKVEQNSTTTLNDTYRAGMEAYKQIKIEGILPKGVITSVTSDQKESMTNVFIELTQSSSNVKVEILTEDNKLITTLVNKELTIGKHDFEWNNLEEGKGIYTLKFFVDDHTMSQRFIVD